MPIRVGSEDLQKDVQKWKEDSDAVARGCAECKINVNIFLQVNLMLAAYALAAFRIEQHQ